MIRMVLAAFVLLLCLGNSGLAQQSGQPLIDEALRAFKGDFDGMKRDKVIRVLIPFSITDYYLENGQEKGLSVEYVREFEKELNKGIRKELDKIRIVLLPTFRDDLILGLIEGKGDIAVANLTITEERRKQVDFSDPYRSNVREIIVTSRSEADLISLDQLAGKEIHTRRSSSYFSSLEKANADLIERGLDPITIVEVDESLEDEDLLEMTNAGMIPAVVIDDYKTKLWLPFFKELKAHNEFALREGADLAWAFRRDSPQLKKVVNAFIAKAKIGTTLGNIFDRRYNSDITKIINPKTEKYQERLAELMDLFTAAGEKHNIDPLLLAAQAFQESRFNNNAKSRVGAVGIMQLLPSTARDRSVGIKNFRELEGNIEAGAKYNRHVADSYFGDPDIPELEKILFVLASYNAGPNRVARVRTKADDPNTWFGHVEWQVAKAAGAEPIKYVKNIYIYYLTFASFQEFDRRRAGQEAGMKKE
ncbi:lytic transglycosylase F [Labrenzia sp. PHM005]|uniref:transglycosylase SLT domain-containing protein n=1 Tax=Labrenzia sp. PHM005 TaxID=2590016 RepID=UPI00143D3F6A|nr:lytic transglycosylase F [Labrenzia sp. PHM005]